MAATLTISSALQPRDKSFAGAANPWRIGPMAEAPASRSTSLHAMFPESRSGKMSVFARPATALPGAFIAPTSATIAASA